ncbi:MAG: hypothetical protein ABR515_08340, partial [Nitrososphaeraceae archaeon]
YNTIKHLVEVDDDILAVFTVTLGGRYNMQDLSIAKNASITNDMVNHIFSKLQENLRSLKGVVDNRLGRLKWTINETERIRILEINEKDHVVVVLIKSNISLSETVDNVLGYYYESENPSEELTS